MKLLQKRLCLIMAVVMLLSVAAVFAGCGTGEENPTHTHATTAGAEDVTAEEDNRFVGVDYKDREFRTPPASATTSATSTRVTAFSASAAGTAACTPISPRWHTATPACLSWSASVSASCTSWCISPITTTVSSAALAVADALPSAPSR